MAKITVADTRDMSVDERFALLHDLWDELEQASSALTDEQKLELDERIAAYRANPDDVIPGDEVRAWLRGEA